MWFQVSTSILKLHRKRDQLYIPNASVSQLVAQLYPTFCNPMDCSTPGFLVITNSWSLLKLMSIKSVMPSNHHILCHPLLLLPAIFPSIRVFSSELALHIRWPKYWNFSFSISPSKEYSGLFSFRIDWFDLLVVQGALKNLLQFHSSLRSSSPSLSLVKCLLIIQVWS